MEETEATGLHGLLWSAQLLSLSVTEKTPLKSSTNPFFENEGNNEMLGTTESQYK